MHIYFFLILSNENIKISLNTDIFETNIVNIILLLILLFVVLKNFLSESLGERKTKILEEIETSEKRLADANERFAEAKKQWSQRQFIFNDINNQTKEIKKKMLFNDCNVAKQEHLQKYNNASLFLSSREQQMYKDVIQEISEKILNQVIEKLKKQLSHTEQSSIIDNKIKRLGDY
uniref:ATP synthase CF0, subunit B n=1 Tax=Choristocarpus tenellus TaxID=116065 RepID=UPI002E779FCA|nr:ATP synthase CF0, subunit B [Choristocarpus tenellus]WAM62342.1 ATP synthase CF0, subunit B [Choristocarpus tenellus]